MGIFSAIAGGLGIASAAADLFGSSDSDKASRRQQATQREQIDFAKEQANLARQDVNRFMPIGDERMRQGYQAATGILQDTAPAQIQPLREASRTAQASLLGGMGAFQNAILGNPTGINANPWQNAGYMQPQNIGHMPTMMRPFQPSHTQNLYQAPVQQPSTPPVAQIDFANDPNYAGLPESYLSGVRSLNDWKRGRFPW